MDKSSSSNPKQPLQKRARATAAKSTSVHDTSGVANFSHRILQGYRWRAPNSCFWDAPLELLYRCFVGLTPAIRRTLVSDTLSSRSKGTKPRGRKPRRSVLQDLITHFEERSKWVLGSAKTYKSEEVGMRMLDDMQATFKELVEDTWGLGEPSNPKDPKSARYGTSESVIGKIFSVSTLPRIYLLHRS